MPDIYQGTELWDLSLVDPDNRRPVDYHIREEMLAAADAPAALLRDWRDGSAKLALLARLLALRGAEPELLAGGYRPLETGDDRLFAFTRSTAEKTLLVAVPRLSAEAAIAKTLPLPDESLGRAFRLPDDLRGLTWRDALAATEAPAPEERALFGDFPAAVLVTA